MKRCFISTQNSWSVLWTEFYFALFLAVSKISAYNRKILRFKVAQFGFNFCWLVCHWNNLPSINHNHSSWIYLTCLNCVFLCVLKLLVWEDASHCIGCFVWGSKAVWNFSVKCFIVGKVWCVFKTNSEGMLPFNSINPCGATSISDSIIIEIGGCYYLPG